MESKSKFLVALLALLGFANCGLIDRGMVEYGSPHADYEIKGKVTGGGSPVEGIRVALKYDAAGEYEIASAKTDSKGDYEIRVSNDLLTDVALTAEDIDGEANGGEFAPQTKTETFGKDDYSGSKETWNMGKAVKTIDFTLELKTEQEDDETVG